MYGKKLSTYAAMFIITLFGAGAALLIVETAHSAADAGVYVEIDPFAPESNF